MLEKYSSSNRANKIRIDQAFAWREPAHILATFFGAGAIYPAPGTWGTLAGAFVFILVTLVSPLSMGLWWVLVAIFSILGALAADKVAAHLGVDDHGSVVIDEVVAIWLVYSVLPHTWTAWLVGFVAFRLFDILKFWPVSWLDKNMKNGWGVIVDDLVAALYAMLASWGVLYALEQCL